ncbi:MAG: hypothetical protein ABUS47_00100 [Steroidobacter sp.]
MPKIPTHWKIFFGIQLFGIMSWLLCGYFKSSLGPALWGAQLLVFLPGYYFLAGHVENLLWGSGATLSTIGFIEITVNVVLNLVIWALAASIIRRAINLGSSKVKPR